MRVRDVMSPRVVTVPPSESCYEAARLMSRHQIHHIAVADGAALTGLVTDRDLRAELFLTVARAAEARPLHVERVLRERRVGDVMSTPVITAGPDDELATAATTMARRRIGALPVMDGGRLVAILTETDILRVLFRHRLFSSPEIESILLFAA